jgi:hypothetical protein
VIGQNLRRYRPTISFSKRRIEVYESFLYFPFHLEQAVADVGAIGIMNHVIAH